MIRKLVLADIFSQNIIKMKHFSFRKIITFFQGGTKKVLT